MSKIEQNIDTQKVTLKGVVEYLECLSMKVGETITEYDWRECRALIYALEQTFQDTHDIKTMRDEVYASFKPNTITEIKSFQDNL